MQITHIPSNWPCNCHHHQIHPSPSVVVHTSVITFFFFIIWGNLFNSHICCKYHKIINAFTLLVYKLQYLPFKCTVPFVHSLSSFYSRLQKWTWMYGDGQAGCWLFAAWWGCQWLWQWPSVKVYFSFALFLALRILPLLTCQRHDFRHCTLSCASCVPYGLL